MSTPTFAFRCPDNLAAALAESAAKHGTERGEIIRRALGQYLRVPVASLAEGFAGQTPEVAAGIRKKGLEIRWKKHRNGEKARKSSRRKVNGN